MENLNEVQQRQWTVDTAHSRVGFSARHMVISQVEGQFDSYKIEIETTGENFEDHKVNVEIDVNSINTGVKDRDNHLKSADFFEAAKFPRISFVSKEIKKIDDENFKLIGDFTIKDITKTIELDIEYTGLIRDPYGNDRAAFTVKGSVDRFDYDLKWNNLIETGGAVVGKTIKLHCTIQMVSPADNNE